MVFLKEFFKKVDFGKKISRRQNNDEKLPISISVTKHEKMLKKRMENIDNYVIPSNEFNLPSIPEGGAAAFTFSLSDGIKIRVSL